MARQQLSMSALGQQAAASLWQFSASAYWDKAVALAEVVGTVANIQTACLFKIYVTVLKVTLYVRYYYTYLHMRR